MLNCSSKISLYAGKPSKNRSPNYGTISYTRRQSAGKRVTLARRDNGRGRFFYDNQKKNWKEIVLLSRHSDCEFQSYNHRQLCCLDKSNLWISYRNENSKDRKISYDVENKDYRIQSLSKVLKSHNSFFKREERRSQASFEICSNLWNKQYSLKRTNETGDVNNPRSSETIRETVSSTEDIVRPLQRCKEIGRNVLSLSKERVTKVKMGSMWEKASDASGRYDAYLADMYYYCEQGCKSFRDQVAIRDIAA